MSDDDAAARAFEGLSAEVAVLRRAVEHLVAERADQVDYSPTLGQISQNLLAATQRVDAMAKSPLLSLTPAAVGTQVERVAADMRATERHVLDGVRRELEAAVKATMARLASARDRDDQRLWLWVSAAGGALVGMLMWLGITGPIARELPASWMVPEKFAANTMGLSTWDAGKKLMAAGNPDMWNMIVANEQMVADNKDAVTACRKAATKVGKAVRCGFKIEP